jgi:hypothetical protein
MDETLQKCLVILARRQLLSELHPYRIRVSTQEAVELIASGDLAGAVEFYENETDLGPIVLPK